MSSIVVFDPLDSTVANRVTGYFPSANTPDFDGEVNKLVNVSLVAVSGVPQRYWKESTGAVVEMTQPEKDSMDPTPTTLVVHQQGTINTTSSAPILADGMTLTPPAGTYAVTWTASGVYNSGNDDEVWIQIYADGVAQGVEMYYQKGNNAGDVHAGLVAVAKVTVNGSQAIEGRWRQAGGTGQMRGRSLLLIEVTT